MAKMFLFCITNGNLRRKRCSLRSPCNVEKRRFFECFSNIMKNSSRKCQSSQQKLRHQEMLLLCCIIKQRHHDDDNTKIMTSALQRNRASLHQRKLTKKHISLIGLFLFNCSSVVMTKSYRFYLISVFLSIFCENQNI